MSEAKEKELMPEVVRKLSTERMNLIEENGQLRGEIEELKKQLVDCQATLKARTI